MKRLFSVLLLFVFISSCLSKRDSSHSDEAGVDTDSSRVISAEKLNSPDTVLTLITYSGAYPFTFRQLIRV